MNILILSPFSPFPFNQGGKVRIFNTIKYLSRSNAVTLAAIIDSGVQSDPGLLRQYCEDIILINRPPQLWRDRGVFVIGRDPYNIIRYSSKAMRRELDRLLNRKSFDVVQIEFPMMWPYADIFHKIPTVLDALNIEHEIIKQIKSIQGSPLRKLQYAWEEKRLKNKEVQAWRECRLCFAVSEKERKVIASTVGHPDKVFTVPNGVDLERFEYHPKPATAKRLLFLGSTEYLPNRDSGLYLLKEIFPLIQAKIPDVKLDFVGRELGRIQNLISPKGVEFHENRPEVLPYFRKADVLLVPLRCGAGTRVKILEAMAAGLPVVTTSKGGEGLEVKDGEQLLIADSPQEFAAAVQKILKEPDLHRSVAKKARDLVVRKYSWEMLVRDMERLYHKI